MLLMLLFSCLTVAAAHVAEEAHISACLYHIGLTFILQSVCFFLELVECLHSFLYISNDSIKDSVLSLRWARLKSLTRYSERFLPCGALLTTGESGM